MKKLAAAALRDHIARTHKDRIRGQGGDALCSRKGSRVGASRDPVRQRNERNVMNDLRRKRATAAIRQVARCAGRRIDCNAIAKIERRAGCRTHAIVGHEACQDQLPRPVSARRSGSPCRRRNWAIPSRRRPRQPPAAGPARSGRAPPPGRTIRPDAPCARRGRQACRSVSPSDNRWAARAIAGWALVTAIGPVRYSFWKSIKISEELLIRAGARLAPAS